MKNNFYLVAFLLLSGCMLSPYAYNVKSENDPEMSLGDRFGGGSVSGASRGFNINIDDAVANRCKDFLNAGAYSNNWSHINDKTKTIRLPAGKSVAIRGMWFYGNSSCMPPVVMFTPEPSAKYSADISMVSNKCYLSIVQVTSDGKQKEVKDISLLPKCI